MCFYVYLISVSLREFAKEWLNFWIVVNCPKKRQWRNALHYIFISCTLSLRFVNIKLANITKRLHVFEYCTLANAQWYTLIMWHTEQCCDCWQPTFTFEKYVLCLRDSRFHLCFFFFSVCVCVGVVTSRGRSGWYFCCRCKCKYTLFWALSSH